MSSLIPSFLKNNVFIYFWLFWVSAASQAFV